MDALKSRPEVCGVPGSRRLCSISPEGAPRALRASTTIYRVNEAPDVPIGSPIELTERQTVILNIIKTDVTITSRRLSQKIGVVERTIKRDLADLQKKGLLKRIGGRKVGHWEIEGSNTRLGLSDE